jgi:hypothetical protein
MKETQMNEQDDKTDAPEEEEKVNTGPIKPPTRESEEQPAQKPDAQRETGEIKPPTE